MKYIFIKISYLLFIALFFVQSCKSKKNVGAKLPSDIAKAVEIKKDNSAFFNNIKQQESNYNYISCLGECEYNDGKNTYNFDIQIEMERYI